MSDLEDRTLKDSPPETAEATPFGLDPVFGEPLDPRDVPLEDD